MASPGTCRAGSRICGAEIRDKSGFGDLMIRKVLTVPEVAEMLAVSEITVWRMVRDGRVKSIKIGASRRILAESVEAIIGGAA